MAKKDTFLALVRRGIDEATATHLAEAGVKIGDLKKIGQEQLQQNYGLKAKVAESVINAIRSGPTATSRQRYLSGILAEKKKKGKVEEVRWKREQKSHLSKLQEERERLRQARVDQFRSHKLIMNRLGKTIDLIVKLENNFDDEGKDDQRAKLRDQLETRGLEAARDHEALNLPGVPQDIADFRRKTVPVRCFHACPECGDEINPTSGLSTDDPDDWSIMCWDCEHEVRSTLCDRVEELLVNGERIKIEGKIKPRNEVPLRPLAPIQSVDELIADDLKRTGATADHIAEAAKASDLAGGLMDIMEWIDQTIAAKGYIQSQEDRDDFILRTGAGATKFNKWMKKAGLVFNKQTGRWTRYEGL